MPRKPGRSPAAALLEVGKRGIDVDAVIVNCVAGAFEPVLDGFVCSSHLGTTDHRVGPF
jgi:hypothetical protein